MDIRKIVKDGYNTGSYTSVFRTSSTPTRFEKHIIDRFLRTVRAKGHILDLGCGTGIPFDKYMLDQGYTITGVDVSSKHIAEAKSQLPQATFIEKDFSELTYDSEFDGITSFYAIFHIPREEQLDLFKNMHRMLKPSGVILITLGTSGGEGIDEDWCGAPMAWSTYEPPQYKHMLEKVGFTILHEEFEGQPGDDEYHYWVIARKN